MRRILLGTGLFVAMVALSQSNAQQPDPEMFKVFMAVGKVLRDNPAALVNNAGVQKELKMDEDQVKAAREKVVAAGFGGFGGGFGKGGGNGKDLTDEQKEKGAKMLEKVQALKDVPEDQLEAKIRETFKEEIEGPTKEVEKILKPEQLTRLKQIARQQGGPGAYLKLENVGDLKVTDEQKKKLKDINDELQKDVGELRRGAGGGKGGFGPVPPEMREKMTALTKEANEKAVDLLTAEQKSKWKELIGEPYTVEFQGGRRPPKKDD